MATVTTDRSIDTLNSFLRGEISAVETYRQALERFGDRPVRQHLVDCMRSHEVRCDAFRRRIAELGGTPATGSGMWGAFAKLVEGGAKLFGEKAAMAALEEGEDHGRNDYLRDLDQLDPESRRFMEYEILPEQERTHNIMSMLKHTY